MSRSRARVEAAAEALGLTVSYRDMPSSTRTAAQAAEACDCAVGQILKSLVFMRIDTGALVLLLIAGDRQADLDAADATIGSALTRADAQRVRAETGFAIGGVAPIGHLSALDVYMDPALLAYRSVWAAAGTPNAVFAVDPAQLQRAIGARLLPE